MKKVLALAALMGVLLASLIWAADSLTGFTITAPTTTTLYCAWTNGLVITDYDSLTIIQSDSTCLAVLSLASVISSHTLTGLNPHTSYKLLVKAVKTAGGIVVSSKDTLATAIPNVETALERNREFLQMKGARSWNPSGIRYDSLYCTRSTGLDSTAIYFPWKYTSMQIKAIGSADSCKVLFRVFAGYAEDSNVTREAPNVNTGFFDFKNVAIDSVNVTQAGWTLPKLLAIPPSQAFYVQADGQTDNGNTTKFILRLYRNKD